MKAVASSKRRLIEAVSQPQRLDTPGKRLAAEYYASGMDLASIEKRGLASLAPLLSQIDALNDRAQLPALLAKMALHRIPAPFSVSVRPDDKDKRRYILVLDQSGLGLPDRDDYFRSDDRTVGLRKAYEAYRQRLAQLSGGDSALPISSQVFAFETELARVVDDAGRAARSECRLQPEHRDITGQARTGIRLGRLLSPHWASPAPPSST